MIDTTATALALYDAGLNVFPVKAGDKRPLGKHGFLTTTRLLRDALPSLMDGNNLAVMCGRLSHNLFILDCDTKQTFEDTGRQLHERGIQAWVRNGEQGGQFWLICLEGEVANVKIGEMDVLGNHKYSVAPPSIHPTGMIYEWIEKQGALPPVVSLAQLDFLPLLLASVSKRKRSEKKYALPPVANKVLAEGDVSGYPSHSEAEFAAVLSLIGAGKSDELICGLFRQFNPPHYAKKRSRAATHFQKYTLAQAHTKHNQQAQGVFDRACLSEQFVQWAQSVAWGGRAGNSDKAVYLALCERYQMEGSMPFRAGVREVAELANMNKETAQAALKRLQEAGHVSTQGKQGKDEYAGCYQYALKVPARQQANDHCINRTLGVHTPTSVGTSVRFMHSEHDAWNGRALGKPGLFCYEQLRIQPASLSELAALLGRDRSTILRTLRKLEAHGLAQVDGETWKAVEATEETLDRIAVLCGTDGTAQTRKGKHQKERQARASDMLHKQIAYCRDNAQ